MSDAAQLPEIVGALNATYADASPQAVLRAVLRTGFGRVGVSSSFGADSAVLLHMVSQIDGGTPVLFLDTGMHFPETVSYRRQLTEALGLSDVRDLRAEREALFAEDPDGLLHRHAPDACCTLRKVRPLDRALAGFDTWITGRKRAQGGPRRDLPLFEVDGPRIKVNPLIHWDSKAVLNYMDALALPRHPKVAEGFPSIGCAPCTQPAAHGREGRWAGLDKTECGIHLPGVAAEGGQDARDR
ncbi:MAG: phosphoadenylyl-sulfate reductase [Shimia sp.]